MIRVINTFRKRSAIQCTVKGVVSRYHSHTESSHTFLIQVLGPARRTLVVLWHLVVWFADCDQWHTPCLSLPYNGH